MLFSKFINIKTIYLLNAAFFLVFPKIHHFSFTDILLKVTKAYVAIWRNMVYHNNRLRRQITSHSSKKQEHFHWQIIGVVIGYTLKWTNLYPFGISEFRLARVARNKNNFNNKEIYMQTIKDADAPSTAEYHTIDDLTTPQIAMADMQVLAAPLKRMYHDIVDDGQFSFPIFLNMAFGDMCALSEVMDTYNTLMGQDGPKVTLQDILGDEIAAAFKFYEEVGEYDVDAKEEEERWYAYLQKFCVSGYPWADPNAPRRNYYCKEEIESFWGSILDEHIPDEPDW